MLGCPRGRGGAGGRWGVCGKAEAGADGRMGEEGQGSVGGYSEITKKNA